MANDFDLNVNPLSGSQLEVLANDGGALDGTEKVLVTQNGAVVETTTQDIADFVGGVVLELYQNTAMSNPVMAYVFKDQSGDIYRVYEPGFNNDVSRSKQTYENSIDKFPFDLSDWYNNVLSDCVFSDLPLSPNASVFNNNSFQDIKIEFNNHHTGIVISVNKWLGNFLGGGTDILTIAGDSVVFKENIVGSSSLIQDMGDNTNILQNILEMSVDLFFGNNTGITCNGNSLKELSVVNFSNNNEEFQNNVVGNGAAVTISGVGTLVNGNNIGSLVTVTAPNNITYNDMGTFATILSTGGTIGSSGFGFQVSYTSAGNVDSINVISVGGVSYQIGEDTGAATLTPV